VQDKIDHAKSYPFPAPDHCYLYEDGDWRPLTDDGFETGGRVPVLAAGSNRSPQQLQRKYGHLSDAGAIPAQRGLLHDFDVVYAAHLTGYGSVPATFQHSPGTRVTVFLLWLNETQLVRMHETERNYTYDHLSGIRIALDRGGGMSEAYAYSSRVGCLNHGGQCISLGEVVAQRRTFPALRQPEMLALARDRLAPGIDVDEFVRQHLADDELRRMRSQALGADALPVTYHRRTLRTL
jgi:hypothetical protein